MIMIELHSSRGGLNAKIDANKENLKTALDYLERGGKIVIEGRDMNGEEVTEYLNAVKDGRHLRPMPDEG